MVGFSLYVRSTRTLVTITLHFNVLMYTVILYNLSTFNILINTVIITMCQHLMLVLIIWQASAPGRQPLKVPQT